ncbi:hypothetical protein BDN72DRAFT_375865 [Pluteus cervinus]|uniref:Uncharacterized protein n=1 Tax=Pluteus cervinus TaxID=181527 RepID=A0ACD3AD56_9AGAR|nr:hypothetical protein BDN72DRAFT_375865 [Pluteus cervinus]
MTKLEAASEISGHIVGPMPIEKFLAKFMPGTSTATEDKSTFKKLRHVTDEEQMYSRWIDALNDVCKPEIVLRDTHDDRVPNQDDQKIGPDVTAYCLRSNETVPECCDLGRAEILMEFKFNNADDPFCGGGHVLERNTVAAKETLGQITMSATAQLALQFRTHAFSLLVFPHYTRILRWDRAGVVVSAKINHQDKGHFITTFFERFGQASPSVRGVDTTVLPHGLNADEEEKVRALLNANSDTVLRKVLVGRQYFIIGDATFISASCAFGRATRCYRAYDPAAAKKGLPCVFILKDSWRIWTLTRPTEYEILKRLEHKGVENVPVAVCGSDVDPAEETDHKTRTQDLVREDWNRHKFPLRALRHFRLVTHELDMHIQDCTTVQDAVIVVKDASIAHQQAYDKAKVVHRDVSWANIMAKRINGILRGYLIDWDMCKLIGDDEALEEGDQVVERTGTWFFIAARLINTPGPTLVQTRVDDVESFFHILVYLASMYTSHTLGSTEELTTFHHSYFLQSYKKDGKDAGGKYKIAFMHTQGLDLLPKLDNTPLRYLLLLLVDAMALRYPKPVEVNPLRKRKNVPELSNDDKELLHELDNNSSWLSDRIADALQLDGWETADTNAMKLHKLPNLENKPNDRYKASATTLAMSHISASEQKYRAVMVKKAEEGKKVDRDGHTTKKRKLRGS